MRVQIMNDTSIPEGYTYTRCDQYAPEYFRSLFTDDDGHVSEYCLNYIQICPKKTYNTDDVIAVKEIIKEHSVGSLIETTGNYTTKQYEYDYGDGLELYA